jgi:hypothetical protein
MNKAEQFLLDRNKIMIDILVKLSNDLNVISINVPNSMEIVVAFCIYDGKYDRAMTFSFESRELFEESVDEYNAHISYYYDAKERELNRTNALNKLTAEERKLLGL